VGRFVQVGAGAGRSGKTFAPAVRERRRGGTIIVGVNSDASALPSLDGREFRMVSSTASSVNEESPSVFEYREQDGVIWGDYTGDTVTIGRFVGTRTGADLTVSFVHVLLADGSVVTGSSASTIEADGDRLKLVERFEIDGEDHVSICVES
jgi:hypothetical protein